MTTFENLAADQRIRASLHRDIQNLCKETCHSLGLDITKAAMAYIFEMFMDKIEIYADYLEAFARHARRFIVTGDDVRLLARRNRYLKARLDTTVPPTPSKEAPKRRRTALESPSTPAKRARDDDKQTVDLTEKE